MPIKVSCACGKKLSVKDEFAGKSFKCPACQKPLLELFRDVAPRETDDFLPRDFAGSSSQSSSAESPKSHSSSAGSSSALGFGTRKGF